MGQFNEETMTLLHDAYVAWMSGLTHKTGNEIHWEDEYGRPITVEPISIAECKYIVRYYYGNGQVECEINCHQGLRHGKYIMWYDNGQKECETYYYQGKLHGKYIRWRDNGQRHWETDYNQGKVSNINIIGRK
jgi:antitoxin component YwqK of YwqJK toxin-antitoxin module